MIEYDSIVVYCSRGLNKQLGGCRGGGGIFLNFHKLGGGGMIKWLWGKIAKVPLKLVEGATIRFV